MKDLAQLQRTITALPCPFAENADWGQGEEKDLYVDPTSQENCCLKTGFSSEYSSVLQNRKDILRKDMNRIGRMATRELHFRQAGGCHEYEDNDESAGYSKDALLGYWDGVFLKNVESQFLDNDVDYRVDPAAIDGLTGSQEKRVWWKTASYIYGVAKSLLSAGGNFSAAGSLVAVPVQSDVFYEVQEDSLVSVGDFIYGLYVQTETDFVSRITVADQLQNMIATLSITPPSATTSIEISLPNKGRNGVFSAVTGLLFWQKLYPAELCGNSNFDLCFFARKGTKIKCVLSANEKKQVPQNPSYPTPTLKVVDRIKSCPVRIIVKEAPDDEG